MSQPYPRASGEAPVGEEQPAPRSVLNAAKFMYAGAVVSAIQVIVSFTTIGGLKNAIRQAYPHYTAAQVHTAEVTSIAGLVISGLLGVGLWVLMARLNLAGRSWARIVASVLFAFNTLGLLTTILRPGTATILGVAFVVVLWVIGLGAIVLLWRNESSDFFQPVQPR